MTDTIETPYTDEEVIKVIAAAYDATKWETNPFSMLAVTVTIFTPAITANPL